MLHQTLKVKKVKVKVVLKNLAAPRFFILLLSVWISDETHLMVFDIHQGVFFVVVFEEKMCQENKMPNLKQRH